MRTILSLGQLWGRLLPSYLCNAVYPHASPAWTPAAALDLAVAHGGLPGIKWLKNIKTCRYCRRSTAEQFYLVLIPSWSASEASYQPKWWKKVKDFLLNCCQELCSSQWVHAPGEWEEIPAPCTCLSLMPLVLRPGPWPHERWDSFTLLDCLPTCFREH